MDSNFRPHKWPKRWFELITTSMKSLTFILIAFSTLLSACGSLVQEVNPDKLVKAAPKLVVACFISPQDTLVAAKITESNSVLGDTTTHTTEIKDATVTLSDGSRSVPLTYRQTEALYRTNIQRFFIVAGKTYTLTVSTPDGRRVTAQATVPPPVPITSVRLDSTLTGTSTQMTKAFFMTFRWQDTFGTPNYYRIAGSFAHTALRSSPRKPDSTITDVVSFRTNQNRRGLFSDEGSDGNVFTTPNGSLGQSLTVNNNDPQVTGKLNAFRLQSLFKTIELRAELLNTDAQYYQYHQSIEQFRDADGNPFAEPVLVPSNIQGGLGCFAAYNRTTLVLRVK